MAGIRPFIMGIGLIILFGISLMMFMIGFITVNNPDFDVSKDPFANKTITQLQERGNELEALGESSQKLLESAEPSPTFLFLIFKASFFIPFGFLEFLIKSVGTILSILSSLFGGGGVAEIVFSLISGLMLITIVILIVRAIRQGETER